MLLGIIIGFFGFIVLSNGLEIIKLLLTARSYKKTGHEVSINYTDLTVTIEDKEADTKSTMGFTYPKTRG